MLFPDPKKPDIEVDPCSTSLDKQLLDFTRFSDTYTIPRYFDIYFDQEMWKLGGHLSKEKIYHNSEMKLTNQKDMKQNYKPIHKGKAKRSCLGVFFESV